VPRELKPVKLRVLSADKSPPPASGDVVETLLVEGVNPV